jgi:oxygen-dependent protoporphyrinogen oxidase
MAAPAAEAGRLLEPLVPEARTITASIESASLVVLNLGFRRVDIGHPLNGFGFLVPHNEPDFPLMGVLWADSIFPHHAPAGHRLIRVFIGGAHDPGAVDRPDEELLSTAIDALRDLLQTSGKPTLVDVCRHQAAVPQYHIGHTRKIERLRAAVAQRPGLWVIGNYLEGVSLNDCVRLATSAANELSRSSAAHRAALPVSAATLCSGS